MDKKEKKEAPPKWIVRKVSSAPVPSRAEARNLISFVRKSFEAPPRVGDERFGEIFKLCAEKMSVIPFQRIIISLDYVPEPSELEKKLDLLVSFLRQEKEQPTPGCRFFSKPNFEGFALLQLGFFVATPADILFKPDPDICMILIREKAEPSGAKAILKIQEDCKFCILFKEILHYTSESIRRNPEIQKAGNKYIPSTKQRILAPLMKGIKRWLALRGFAALANTKETKQKKSK